MNLGGERVGKDLDRIRFGGCRPQYLNNQFFVLPEQRGQYVLLHREMTVEGARRDAHDLADLLHGGRDVAVGDEQVPCGESDGPPQFLPPGAR